MLLKMKGLKYLFKGFEDLGVESVILFQDIAVWLQLGFNKI